MINYWAEELINGEIEEISSHEKLISAVVIYFIVRFFDLMFFCQLFISETVFWYKIWGIFKT